MGLPLAPPAPSPRLRVAAVWGTAVLAMRTLERGESVAFGDTPSAMLPIPDGQDMPSLPVKATSNGWEVDARGVTGGTLTIRGRREDARAAAQGGAPIPVTPGDWGLLEYGPVGLYFQYVSGAEDKLPRARPEAAWVAALLASVALHVGSIVYMRGMESSAPTERPSELASSGPEIDSRRSAYGVLAESDPSNGTRGTGSRGFSMGDLLQTSTSRELEEALRAVSPLPPAVQRGPAPAAAPAPITSVQEPPGTSAGHEPPGLHASPSPAPGAARSAPLPVPAVPSSPLRREVIPETLKSSGALRDDDVRRAIGNRVNAFSTCYGVEAERSPGLAGSVVFAWRIEGSGAVDEVKVVSSTLSNAKVESCALQQIRATRFPASDGPTQVSGYTLRFRLGDE